MIVSSSDRNTSFTEKIKKEIDSNSETLTETHWIQFLRDHRELLREKSEVVTLSEADMLKYRYRISDFLADKNYLFGAEQAFRIVNRFHNDSDFNLDVKKVYLPNDEDIMELRRLYNTDLFNRSSARWL